MNNEVMQHIEKSLNEVRALFTKAATRIEALKPGEKVPATQLAEDLAKEQGTTGPALYPLLKTLFNGYPGVNIRRGAHGGLIKLAPGEVPTAQDVKPSKTKVVKEVLADDEASV
jgi:hypothetical protein